MRIWMVPAGLHGAMAVAMAAWAAHGVTGQAQILAERASLFQLVHAVALVALTGVPLAGRHWAGLAWNLGIVLFSGSLYLKAWSVTLPVPMVTPAGGLLFMAGWLLLGVMALRKRG